MTTAISIFLIIWGVRSLFSFYRKKYQAARLRKECRAWAETTIREIEDSWICKIDFKE